MAAGVVAAGVTAAGVAATSPVTAADHKRTSQLTTLDIPACKVVKRHADGNAYRCAGLPGHPVYFAEGDLRTFLSFGQDAAKRRAAEQTLGPFNTVFEGKRRRTTIEWRIAPRAGKPEPHAAIVRYHATRDKVRSDVLVVTRIGAKDACHVAYVDAKANPDAILLARRAADEDAPRFDCTKEPQILGTPGPLLGN